MFYFNPYLGKIPILTNIFQMAWNHQPESSSAPFAEIIWTGSAALQAAGSPIPSGQIQGLLPHLKTSQRMADNFRTLGLPCTATQEEVKSASGLKGVARLLQRDRSIFVGLGKRPYLDLLNFEDIPVIEIGS